MDLSVRAYAINVDLNIASKKLVEFFSLYKNFSNFVSSKSRDMSIWSYLGSTN